MGRPEGNQSAGSGEGMSVSAEQPAPRACWEWTSGRCPAGRWSSGSVTAPELGTAVHEYRHAVMDDTLAATGEQLPPDWALQDPEDYRDVLRQAVPAAIRQARDRPGPGHRHRHRLHRVHGHAGAAERDAAVPAARAGRATARLSQAVEASRRPAAGGPDQRPGARARRAVDRQVRRQDLGGVAVRQGPAAARRGSRDLLPRRPVDRGGRLDHLAAHRRRDQERVHGRVQGHPAGRPLPVARVPGRARSRVRRASPRTSWSTRCCRSAPGPAR